MDFEASGELGGLIFLIALGIGIVTVIVHIAFAGAVWSDASDLQRTGRGTALTGPFFWTAATLLGGVFVAAVYWLMHHSTLSRRV
ncbi:MAG: hypothetical protein ACF8NJ_10890 [Phycisphaerales bacterium JB038]